MIKIIAPCGMNCGLCIGHLRDKKPCGGCYRIDDPNKPKVCRSCKIANCELLAETESGYCFDCKIYPCTRLKNLDLRYKSKYGMSMIENLDDIKKSGIETFLKAEDLKWKCKVCGATICVHRVFCLNCKTIIDKKTY
ncbi:MAG TPA: DUF3795 domain-containing protein [Bacteroidales bacterium]|nr:DUF3795 domain-containing protein [Bacteroidales bacterium]